MTYYEVMLPVAARLARHGRRGAVLAAGVAIAVVVWTGMSVALDTSLTGVDLGAVLGLAAGLSPLMLLVPWMISHRPARPAARLTVPVDDVLPAAWTADAAGPSDPMNAILLRLSLLGVVQLQTAETGPPRYALALRVSQTDVPLPTDLTGSREVLSDLGLRAGKQRVIDADSIPDGTMVEYIDNRLSRLAGRAALERGWVTPSIAGVVGYGAALALPFTAILVALLLEDAPLALGLALAGVSGAFVDPSMLFNWSPEGRRIREQSLALREAMGDGGLTGGMTDDTRFGTYETLLPWAAAFGIVGRWTESCRVPENTLDPVGVWASAALGATAVAGGALAAVAEAERESRSWWGGGGDGGGGGGWDGGGDGGGE